MPTCVHPSPVGPADPRRGDPGRLAPKPLAQLRPPPPCPRSFNSDGQCLPLPYKDDEALAAGHPRIDQVALQHRVVLGRQRDDHRRVLRALALMDCRRVGEHQLVELAKAVGNFAAIEIDVELAFLHVDVGHDAEVPVVDLLVIIVLDLHDLVARTEGPAETVNADLARRVQHVLQLYIERAGTEAAPIHWAENLDVAYRVEPEALWDALLHDRQQLSHSLFRVRRVDEVEVTAVGSGEIGHQAVVDAMRIDDDPALGSLPEDLGQAHHRHGPRSDDVA